MVKSNSPWVSTAIAADRLGLSVDFLLRNRSLIFRRGQHWRVKNPRAYRPTYQWHLKNLDKFLSLEAD